MPTAYVEGIHKLILKSAWIYKGPMRQNNFEEEKEFTLPYIKT